MRQLTYWSSGGDLVRARGQALTWDDALALRAVYLDEARAAAGAGDQRARAVALKLAGELRAALNACARWRRAAAPTPA